MTQDIDAATITEWRRIMRRLLKLIKASGVSQNKVAEAAGYSHGYLTQLLSDRYPANKLTPHAMGRIGGGLMAAIVSRPPSEANAAEFRKLLAALHEVAPLPAYPPPPNGVLEAQSPRLSRDASRVLQDWGHGSYAMVLYGPAGCGKTTSVVDFLTSGVYGADRSAPVYADLDMDDVPSVEDMQPGGLIIDHADCNPSAVDALLKEVRRRRISGGNPIRLLIVVNESEMSQLRLIRAVTSVRLGYFSEQEVAILAHDYKTLQEGSVKLVYLAFAGQPLLTHYAIWWLGSRLPDDQVLPEHLSPEFRGLIERLLAGGWLPSGELDIKWVEQIRGESP